MFKKVFATALSVIFILSLLLPMAIPVMAEPYKEFKVGEGETVIEAVYFDGGEENYHKDDPEAGNHDIRPDEGVATHDYDKQGGFVGGRAESGLACIGWIQAGEWVQHTIQVEISGVYDFSLWGGAGPGGDIKLSCDGREIGTVFVEDNGEGWQDYALYNVGPFHMTAGTHVIRTDFLDGGVNYESFVVKLIEAREDAPPIIWKPKNFVITSSKTVITATDFDPGKYGKAPADGKKDLRPEEDVNTEFGDNKAVEFGGNIGWIAAGDWVQYTVTVQRDGVYKFAAWLASDADPTGGVIVSVDDKVVGTSPNSAKDGWQTYALYDVGEAEIVAGEHVIKVEFNGGLNFTALEVTRAGDIPSNEPPPAAADDNAGDDAAAPADGNEGDDAGNNDNANANNNSSSASDDDGLDIVPFIIIGAVLVVVVVVIIILVAKKKK